jgi:hypothetical protein
MIIDPDESNHHDEPCLQCGEETAVGSVFYSDRREVQLKDGSRSHLCSDCIQRIRTAEHHEGVTDAELVAQWGMGGIILLTH